MMRVLLSGREILTTAGTNGIHPARTVCNTTMRQACSGWQVAVWRLMGDGR